MVILLLILLQARTAKEGEQLPEPTIAKCLDLMESLYGVQKFIDVTPPS